MTNMGYLDETLRAMGATDAQLNSATAKLFNRAMLQDSEFCQKVAADALERIAKKIENAEHLTAYVEERCDRAVSRTKDDGLALAAKIEAATRHYTAEAERCERMIKASKDVIYDAELNEAVKAYRAVLVATKEVMGDSLEGNLSPEPIVAAINAASYIAWRGIMGPAAKPQEGVQIQNISYKKSLGRL